MCFYDVLLFLKKYLCLLLTINICIDSIIDIEFLLYRI